MMLSPRSFQHPQCRQIVRRRDMLGLPPNAEVADDLEGLGIDDASTVFRPLFGTLPRSGKPLTAGLKRVARTVGRIRSNT